MPWIVMNLNSGFKLADHFDCVVMLAWPDRHTGPQSDCYRYATELVKHLPVMLVQPDWPQPLFRYELTETRGLVILHVPYEYGSQQSRLLNRALVKRRFIKPLLLIYNPHFADFIVHRYSPLKIYHATEDYFGPGSLDYNDPDHIRIVNELRIVLKDIDLLIPASEGIRDSYIRNGGYSGRTLLVASGCDFEFCNSSDSGRRLLKEIETITNEKVKYADRLNVLFLYDDEWIHTRNVLDHLESFAIHSESRVHYALAANDAACMWDLALFDAVVIHYTIRSSLPWHLSRNYVDSLRNYGGLKLLFIQDEYDATETARRAIENLGIHVVFTCVPEEFIRDVYPPERFPNVKFIQVLTGYVPLWLQKIEIKPLRQRRYVIGYRGRPLPYFYGILGQEKIIIGQRMRQICEEKNIPVNIEWEEDKRIYGSAWFDFLMDCRATLGTESGSNVFDEYGDIKDCVEETLRTDPGSAFSKIHERCIGDREGKIVMNQISPKVFEAIACGTALVLFEGTYSGVIEPHIHYIPLKKDFSNVDEVLEKLNDDAYLEELTGRAYNDIVASGKFSYKKVVQEFDELISAIVRRGNGALVLSCYSRMRMS